MKSSSVQERKLTKSELKKINGAGPPYCPKGFCKVPGMDRMVKGLVAKDGYCC